MFLNMSLKKRNSSCPFSSAKTIEETVGGKGFKNIQNQAYALAANNKSCFDQRRCLHWMRLVNSNISTQVNGFFANALCRYLR